MGGEKNGRVRACLVNCNKMHPPFDCGRRALPKLYIVSFPAGWRMPRRSSFACCTALKEQIIELIENGVIYMYTSHDNEVGYDFRDKS